MTQQLGTLWRAIVSGLLVCGATNGADEPQAAVPASTAAWAPPLYGFCMEIFDAKKRPLPDQAQMLRELGFAGVGYPLWLGEDLDKNLRILDEAGLKLYLVYANVNVGPNAAPYDARVPDAIRKLKGRPTTVSVLLQGLPPGDPGGEQAAVQALRALGDVAAEAGLRISIYHHTGDWTASLLHTLQVVKLVNHPQVGANFNLCHWLMVDGDKDYRPVLREHAAKIFAVTINGAQLGTKKWTDGLIQPLDQGNFDNRQLLATLREIGYRGPIGLMCYGIPGDAREHLERSLNVWKAWGSEWAGAAK
jgi:sugar phosphate isomerase/epimerase